MRTQKEIAATIIEQGADYVLPVKDKNDARRHGGLQGTRSAPQAKAPLQAAGQREPNRLKPAISFTVNRDNRRANLQVRRSHRRIENTLHETLDMTCVKLNICGLDPNDVRNVLRLPENVSFTIHSQP